jgi:hypothetical protein
MPIPEPVAESHHPKPALIVDPVHGTYHPDSLPLNSKSEANEWSWATDTNRSAVLVACDEPVLGSPLHKKRNVLFIGNLPRGMTDGQVIAQLTDIFDKSGCCGINVHLNRKTPFAFAHFKVLSPSALDLTANF